MRYFLASTFNSISSYHVPTNITYELSHHGDCLSYGPGSTVKKYKMCGIWALFGLDVPSLTNISKNFERIAHRGPEAFKLEFDHAVKNGYLGFHRLAIVDNLHGMQPMRLYQYPHLFLLCNGEIYNCQKLGIEHGFTYTTRCDVEVIIHLYVHLGIENVTKMLDGVFAFCLMDIESRRILIGRDPYGVRPLFRLSSDDGQLGICSESKGLMEITKQMTSKWTLEPFQSGCYEEYEILNDGLSSTDVYGNIRKLLSVAVKKRLMCDREVGCLLSGGLDSSLIAALLVKHAKEMKLPYKIKSFAIGMGNSPDIIAARQVAEHIGTEHHEVIFSEDDVVDILDKLIYQLETCDITTIRASIGMYLISRYIKYNTKATVIFSGEGADELAQGYIYFRDAPNATEAHNESVRLLKDIYLYDSLRADRTTSAFSLELRVPFLDIQFTNYYLSLDAASRQPQGGIEKYLLRSAFDDMNLLPSNILWRHKEAFSDGVTSFKKSLFHIIDDIVDTRISHEELEKACLNFPHCPPKTKEALYYRKVFEKHYAEQAKNFMPYFWMPRWTKGICDPSARFIAHYKADVENNHKKNKTEIKNARIN